MVRALAVLIGAAMAVCVMKMGRSWGERDRHDRWFADRPGAEQSIRDGALPESLPRMIRNVYERRDASSGTVWARFELEPTRRPVLETEWQSASEDSVKVADPGRALWWPRSLRGQLSRSQLNGAGFQTYRVKLKRDAAEARGWLFVDWKVATAYYFLPGA